MTDTHPSPTDISEQMVEAGQDAVIVAGWTISRGEMRAALEAAAPILRAQDAARIAELEAERDRWKATAGKIFEEHMPLLERKDALERENRVMREALTPLAQALSMFNNPSWPNSLSVNIEIGLLRNAAAALASGKSAPTRDARTCPACNEQAGIGDRCNYCGDPVALSPCPFCGGRAAYGSVDDENHPSFGGQFIECADCAGSTGLIFANKDEVRSLLAERWNERAIGSAPTRTPTDVAEGIWSGVPADYYPSTKTENEQACDNAAKIVEQWADQNEGYGRSRDAEYLRQLAIAIREPALRNSALSSTGESDPDAHAGLTYLEAKARDFALRKHSGQKYGPDLPYSYHLERTVEVLRDFGASETMLAAGWLHDVVEDTDTHAHEIAIEFGVDVADLVWAVTGEGASRRERNESQYRKIIEHRTRDAAILKYADRIANSEAGVRFQSHHVATFRKELPAFEEHLGALVPEAMRTRLRAALTPSTGESDPDAHEGEVDHGHV